jgi:hypothetical protein
MRRSLGVSLAMSVLLAMPARAGLAQEASEARARNEAGAGYNAEQLFREAHALLKERRYAESCAKFAESQRVEPASGTLLALAYCEEQAGRLATAWQRYRDARQLAAEERHAEREAAAAERAAALFPRLSTLTVKVPRALGASGKLRVRRDGQELQPDLWGTPLPVDGGRYVVEAGAPGEKSWSITITVRSEGDHQTVTISDVQVGASAPLRGAAERTSPDALPVDAGRKSQTRALRYGSLGLVLGSVVSFGIGAGLALAASSKNDQSNSNGHCTAGGCDPRGVQLRNDALSRARWATVSFVVGGALLASGVTLFVVADTRETPSKGFSSSAGAVRFVGVSGAL